MGGLTAARLCNFVLQALHTLNIYIHLWSDSQIALHWITGKKGTNAFVSHRVAEIHNLSGRDCWRYCPTQDNPADLLTRGITSSQLKMSIQWKHGPPWLTSSDSWPTWQFPPDVELQALAVVATTFTPSTGTQTPSTTSIDTLITISHYSSLTRLLRVTAYLYRFINNCKKQQGRLTGPLTPSELHHALATWVKQCQEEVYSGEITSLTPPLSTRRPPLTRQLRLFLDEDHLLRCGGRIHNAPISKTAKFPILLPPKHMFTALVVQSVHLQLFHSGTNATLTAIRQSSGSHLVDNGSNHYCINV